MTLGERIKKVRRDNDLTQQLFAAKIGTTANVLTNYETGRRNPSSSVINNICKTFNVNEDWLRDGTGEMYMPRATAALDLLAVEQDLTNGDYRLIEKFLNLKPEMRKALIDYAREVAAAIANDEDAGISSDSPVALASDSTGIPITDAEIKRNAARYEDLAGDVAYGELRRAGVDPKIEAEVEAYRQRLIEEKKRFQQKQKKLMTDMSEQPKIPTLVFEDGLNDDEESFMESVTEMNPGQQEQLFDQYNQMRTMREQQKDALNAFAPPTTDDKVPESGLPDQS